MAGGKSFSFIYDRKTHTIRNCTIPSLNGLQPEALFSKPEAAEVFADVRDFKTGWLIDALEVGEPVSQKHGSLSTGSYYTLMVIRGKRDETLFSMHREGRFRVGKATRRLYLISFAIMLAIIAVCATVIVMIRRDMMSNKREEARETMQMIPEQIDSTIVVKFNAWYNELHSASSLIDEYGTLEGNESAIDKLLNNYRQNLPFENIGVLLESGDLYFSGSQTYSIFSESLAKNLIINNVSAIDLINIDGEDRIVFGIPLESVGARSSQTLAAVCGIAPVSAVNKLLNVTAFDSKSVVAVYKDDGFSVAISENAVPPKDESRLNFFVDMEVQKNSSDFKNLEADYQQGSSFLTTATYGGEGYFIYHSSLNVMSDEDVATSRWHLVIYAPESAIFNSVNQMFNTVMAVMAGSFCLLVIAMVLVVFLFIKKHGNDLAMKKQLVANEMLETATDRALEASQAKTIFLSNMSHDIRTPINGIIGMTTIAQKHIDERDTVRDCLKKIEGASAHLLSLINDVLDMSRIESKKIEITRDVMNIHMVMQECCSIVAGQMADRNIDFSSEAKNILHPDVLGDNLHLRQILINILGNSVKFTPDGGHISFSVEEGAQRDDIVTYYFTVRDTGCGMTKEFLSHIFEPFAQENVTGRTNYQGTGLGLAISLQLAKLMGGIIRVESELNKGSTFCVELPFEISSVSVMEQDKKDAADDFDLTGVRVLLVEDNDLNMELATVLLTESGLLVEGAGNGMEACEMFASHKEHYYDLILMDVMMPVMDGITATKTIRSMDHPEAASVPIIAMTANAFEADIRKTREAGMNAHLSKPIYIKEVLRVIRGVLGKK